MCSVASYYISYPPLAAAFDTETDGLHIIRCKPFIFQFGWYSEVNDTIYAYAVDLTVTKDWRTIIDAWHEIVTDAPVYLAHNVKFDMHMLTNIGVQYPTHNLSDTQFYMRFAHDNVSARQGGIVLKLKEYCSKYIDPNAKLHDKLIQQERTLIAKMYNDKLKKKLGWTLKKIDDFFKDQTNTSEDFPTVQDYLHYIEWRNELPKELQYIEGRLEQEDIPYTMVNRQLVLEYALDDIVWVLKVFLQTNPVIDARGTRVGLNLENNCILPLWEMEREGLTIDRQYVDVSFIRMRKYIRQRRQDLKDLTGMDITASQNAVILKYLQDNGLAIDGTGSDILDRIHKDYPNHPTQPVIDCIRELRTLEKWFSTYLMRFKDQDKVYTQINQVGAASLRMSSDFQQFPKKGLKDNEGKELFNPRRAVKVNAGQPMVYLDYSQIELRVQALYTILVGHPDTNLCRAYMPFRCVKDGQSFDYTTPEGRAMWHHKGWTLEEDSTTEWTPTDVHGATTKAAFNIDEHHKDYNELRSLGKRVNFAKNYGAQHKKIGTMFPDYDDATITAIDQGYYKAFPGIKYYQEYCYNIGRHQPYATNLFGIRYWGVSGHNLINMLIQGSSATLLKAKIVELYWFLKNNNYKTKMVIPIHDEIQFSTPENELDLIPQLQWRMEQWDDSYIPIVADAEITRTYWSEKGEYHAA